MCHQYSDNRYPLLWIGHGIMVLTLLLGCFKKKYAICKKFIGLLLMIFHSFWLVGDISCYTPVIYNVIALFSGMYITLLIAGQTFDGCLGYCKCWGRETQDDAIMKNLQKQLQISSKSNADSSFS